jgi:multiple sugar transport system substrate-binding protein
LWFLFCLIKFERLRIHDENILKFAGDGGVVPTKTSLLAGFAKANPQMAAWTTVVQSARARTGILGAGWPAAATKIYKAYQYAIVGGKTAAQAAAAAAASK